MYKFQLYISGEKIDLFKDETITLNSTVQNIKDISKVFTDFTQTFTIPASPINNKIFDHWYNIDITKADGVDSFSSAVRIAGIIELNHLPFRKGLVQMDKAQLKNNIPYSYKVTFYGDLVNLSDLFGEDVLNDLDLSAFNHTFNSANVILGLEGAGLSTGDVIYPLISPERNWLWDSNDTDDIEYVDASTPSTSNGIAWNELKPAIKLINIIEAIETKYSITFSNNFFGTSDFDKLFMWASKDKGYMAAYGVPTLLTLGGNTSFSGTVSGNQTYPGYPTETIEIQRFTLTVTPSTGFETVEYSIIIDDAVTPITHEKTGTGTAVYEFSFPPPTTIVLEFKVQSEESFTFTANLKQWTREWKDSGVAPLYIDEQTILNVSTASTVSTTGYVYFTDELVDGVLQQGQMPTMKVGNFISSLFKMFNLTILPTASDAFDVMTLDDWYANGTTHDINKYVKNDTELISRPNLNRRISYEYNEGETILAEQFKNTNGDIGYGDLASDFDYDGGALEIRSEFENIIFERLSSQTTGALSEVHVGKIIDDKLEAVSTNPLVFYNKGVTTITANGFAFINDAGTRSEITDYNNIGQENDLADGDITNSINFGSEVNTWTLTVQTESLYSNYWEDYVSDLYDSKRRIFDFKAVLPLIVITKIQLNDILIIRERSYIINNMNIDFTTGETKLQLLNYIGQLTGTHENKFFEYDLNVPL